jgi:hypothetical protein
LFSVSAGFGRIACCTHLDRKGVVNQDDLFVEDS